MVALLRHRRVVRDVRLELPNGDTRLVKVTTEDHGNVQHVADWTDRVHGTGRPNTFSLTLRRPSRQRRSLLLRNMGMPKIRQAFARPEHTGPWVPVPGSINGLEVK